MDQSFRKLALIGIGLSLVTALLVGEGARAAGPLEEEGATVPRTLSGELEIDGQVWPAEDLQGLAELLVRQPEALPDELSPEVRRVVIALANSRTSVRR